MNQKQIKKIEKQVEEFFDKAGFPLLSSNVSENEKVIKINIRIEEPKLLIGERGNRLMEVQRILKLLVLKDVKEPFFVDLDINDYKEKKNEALRELAKEIADDVSLTRKKRILEPMTSYERRIIHLELDKREDIITESTGEEPYRKIVVSPK
ncbi:MAG: R3H domain-containing nucleic acid-binding protein [bacterium]|nr:R3H domain-containing nucleic acid-binding protein [bacterium]